MENSLTSGDLMQGHIELAVGDFESALCDNSKLCQSIPISICTPIKIWSSQNSIFCCDLEKRSNEWHVKKDLGKGVLCAH